MHGESLGHRVRRALADDAGSSPVEFVLVGALLTLLTLAVIQLALGVYVRNVAHDAAVEGAFHAALADTTLAQGAERTRELVARAVGEAYAGDITVAESADAGAPAVRVTVRTTLPLLGLLGVERALEVTAHAPLESLD
ncbi:MULTISPECIES: TadE/TadG family type IV pilus assembly protein [Microbacterium]|uniref:TadE family protein n=1 Tax=Microbacterium wangchenii TaxID=2541726 RepID=A0ABX5STR1_9MICO|nr:MULTISPECIES: TadE/TadG family type IV pilus assembly protein [Microbacterium]MCK6067941.1 pilus assembly protein [Microbacterium sp. EYE_512]QBR89177.1 TadE family protein [Microbacterium wangchenii]TFV81768.1 TadE family protein [Microbacterium sp. dk485]